MKRVLTLLGSGLLFCGAALAIDVQVTVPEGVRPALEEVFKGFSSEEVPLKVKYVPDAETQFVTETDILFNPDAGSRTLIQGRKHLVFLNPKSTLDSKLVWTVETARWLGLSEPLLLPKERTVTDQDRRTLKTLFASKGDFNGDGRLDLLDLSILARNLGKEGGPGDLDLDGKVTDADVALFKELYPK